MVRPSAPVFRLAALPAFLLVLGTAAPGQATCDPTTDPDQSDIASARAAIAANCDCAGATSHGAYVSCAVQQADAVLVNKGCERAVKRCAARSICGKPGAVTCCVTRTTGTKCKIKRDAAHCAAPLSGAACVGAYASCCDACAPGGCATTTSTTTTTLAGVCGDNVVNQPSEQCDGNDAQACLGFSCGPLGYATACMCCGYSGPGVGTVLPCCDPSAVFLPSPNGGICLTVDCTGPFPCTVGVCGSAGQCCAPLGDTCVYPSPIPPGVFVFPCCPGLQCGGSSVGSTCCVSDGGPCASNADCCSSTCDAGTQTCTP